MPDAAAPAPLMKPGRYLALRRATAELSLDDVARMLSPAPHGLDRVKAHIAEVEADGADAASYDLVDELRRCFAFDVDVYHLLVAHHADPECELPLPQICRTCGCTLYDACDDDEHGSCAWAEIDLCTACVPTPAANDAEANDAA